jgi:hypothetical protein
MEARLEVTAHNQGNETHFEGEVRVAGKTFSYKLEFKVPVSQYMAAARGRTISQMRQLVPISISVDGKEVSLTDHEWEIFYGPTANAAVTIYNSRRAMRNNSIERAAFSGGMKVLLSSDACKLLAQPKFGCQFLDSSPTEKTN